MTCLTCHSVHGPATPEMRSRVFRDRCLSCHDVTVCGEAPAARRATATQAVGGRPKIADDCVQCHMPPASVYVRHRARTVHRIGIHDPPPVPLPATTRLVARHDVETITDAEAERNLGLAYMRWSMRGPDGPSQPFLAPEVYHAIVRRGGGALWQAYEAGEQDVEVLAALAFLEQNNDRQRAHEMAVNALSAPGANDPAARARVLRMVAFGMLARDDAKAAIGFFEELTGLSRSAKNFEVLSALYLKAGAEDKARAAMEEALVLDGSSPELHDIAARFFQQLGDRERAGRHRRISRALQARRDAAYR